VTGAVVVVVEVPEESFEAAGLVVEVLDELPAEEAGGGGVYVFDGCAEPDEPVCPMSIPMISPHITLDTSDQVGQARRILIPN